MKFIESLLKEACAVDSDILAQVHNAMTFWTLLDVVLVTTNLQSPSNRRIYTL